MYKVRRRLREVSVKWKESSEEGETILCIKKKKPKSRGSKKSYPEATRAVVSDYRFVTKLVSSQSSVMRGFANSLLFICGCSQNYLLCTRHWATHRRYNRGQVKPQLSPCGAYRYHPQISKPSLLKTLRGGWCAWSHSQGSQQWEAGWKIGRPGQEGSGLSKEERAAIKKI